MFWLHLEHRFPIETEARHGAVEATGGFIGKEQGGLREQLGGEGQATPLTAWSGWGVGLGESSVINGD